MAGAVLLIGLVAFGAKPEFTTARNPSPEYGHGLSEEEARAGWISLFDGGTGFGWKGGKVTEGRLSGGVTTAAFGDCELRGEVVRAGKISLGGRTIEVSPGRLEEVVQGPGPIRLHEVTAVRTLLVRPLNLKQVFNGRDLEGWAVLRHPRLPAERQAKWTVEEDKIRALGGPGGLELGRRIGDLVLQIDVRTRAELVNGGVFFRSLPGEFLNGYEAQVFNACYGRDPARPARYSTGAIDDRQLARRLVSRDRQTFTMTVIAVGPHIATWVNGVQLVDWTDHREPHENPREGRRLEPGTIQLQAHDPESDLEFSNIRVGEIK